MNTRSVRAREDAETRFKRKTEEVVLASRAAADYAAAHKAALVNMERLKALRAARDAGAAASAPIASPQPVAAPAKRARQVTRTGRLELVSKTEPSKTDAVTP